MEYLTNPYSPWLIISLIVLVLGIIAWAGWSSGMCLKVQQLEEENARLRDAYDRCWDVIAMYRSILKNQAMQAKAEAEAITVPFNPLTAYLANGADESPRHLAYEKSFEIDWEPWQNVVEREARERLKGGQAIE